LLWGDKPGPLLTVVAGLGGCLAGFLVGHQVLQLHEFHLFAPESLMPAVVASVIILLVIRRVMRATQRTWLFR